MARLITFLILSGCIVLSGLVTNIFTPVDFVENLRIAFSFATAFTIVDLFTNSSGVYKSLRMILDEKLKKNDNNNDNSRRGPIGYFNRKPDTSGTSKSDGTQ